MSHFTCLVIGADPEGQLAPYQGNGMECCSEEYLVFNDLEERYRNKFESGEESDPAWYPNGTTLLTEEDFENVKNIGGLIKKDFIKPIYPFRDDYLPGFKVCIKKYDPILDVIEHDDDVYVEVIEFSKKIQKDQICYDFYFKVIDPPKMVPHNKTYPTFYNYLEDYFGAEIDSKTGKYGSWENPNQKWDWYVLGGRWNGFFKIKKQVESKYVSNLKSDPSGKLLDGIYVNQALKKDIDFEGMLSKQIKIAKERWYESETDHSPSNFYRLGRTIQDSEEMYITKQSELQVHSFVKESRWYAKSTFGWLSKYQSKEDLISVQSLAEVINLSPDDTLLTMYDCHN